MSPPTPISHTVQQNEDISTGLHQHAKKVVSDSLGLVDFAIGLVN